MKPRPAKKQKKSKNVGGTRNDKKGRRRPDENHQDHETSNTKEIDSTSNLLDHEELQQPQLSVSEACDLIAELSESILEDPDSAFFSTAPVTPNGRKGISKMRQLLALAHCSHAGNDSNKNDPSSQHIAKLAILSLLAIFQDILPAYRIRTPTAQEMSVKVSKDVKKIWDYERNLLHHYQQYLQLLEKCWNQAKQQHPNTPPTPLQITGILSLCELLKTAFGFNFRSNLLAVVVRHMNTGLSAAVSEACCKAIETVFEKDAQGEVAAEAARLVAKMIKNNPNSVKPAVIRTFLKLPLKVHADEAEAAKIAAAAAKKNRKRDRETAAIEAERKESEAVVDKLVLARCQADTLQAVMLTYFQILKKESQPNTEKVLLSAALEGLARFAHLVNLDTVLDLLALLKELLADVDALPLEAALNCILTAFQTLEGPGQELKIDLKEYVTPLYRQLPRLEESQTDLMLTCLQFALCKHREYSHKRVAAFFKQILSTALHTSPSTCVPLVAFCRLLLQRYPLDNLLENEQDVMVTANEYYAENPEYPSSASAWELALLKFHMVPDIARQAQAAADKKVLQLPAEGPERLRAEKQKQADDLYIEFARIKKKHPLGGFSSGDKDKNKRKQVRFITPRRVTMRLVPEEEKR